MGSSPDWSLTGEGCSCEAVGLAAIVEEFKETHPGEVSGDFVDDLERMGVEQKCMTFVSWKNCFRGTELNLDSNFAFFKDVAYKGIWYIALNFVSGRLDTVEARNFNFGNAFPHQFQHVSVEYLETLTQEGFLFVRKIFDETLVDTGNGTAPASEVLPALWAKVDTQQALSRMWSRADHTGQPASPPDRPASERPGQEL